MNEGMTVITDHLFDGTNFREEPLCIDITGEKIAGIRPFNGRLAGEKNYLDARGCTVMPGIINAHVHMPKGGNFYESNEAITIPQVIHNLRAMLNAGVTTVGDMGSVGAFHHAIRTHTQRNPEAGPSIRMSGAMLTAPNGYPVNIIPAWLVKMGAAITCDTTDEARRAVQRLAKQGVDHIKLMIMHKDYAEQPIPSVLKVEVAREIVKEAHNLGMRALAHAWWLEDYRLAVDAGVDGLMHSCADALDKDMVKKIADAGILLCPTVFITEATTLGAEERYDQNLAYTRFVSQSYQKDWHKYCEAYAVSGERIPPMTVGGGLKTKSVQEVKNAVNNLIKLRDAGVKIALGNDANYGFCQLGRPVDELKAMQRAGLSMLECLRAATTGAASILGCTDRGEIVKGKRADIIVVHSDLKENAGDIEQVRDVIIAGRLLEDDPARRSLLALKTAVAAAWGFSQAGLWFVAGR